MFLYVLYNGCPMDIHVFINRYMYCIFLKHYFGSGKCLWFLKKKYIMKVKHKLYCWYSLIGTCLITCTLDVYRFTCTHFSFKIILFCFLIIALCVRHVFRRRYPYHILRYQQLYHIIHAREIKEIVSFQSKRFKCPWL